MSWVIGRGTSPKKRAGQGHGPRAVWGWAWARFLGLGPGPMTQVSHVLWPCHPIALSHVLRPCPMSCGQGSEHNAQRRARGTALDRHARLEPLEVPTFGPDPGSPSSFGGGPPSRSQLWGWISPQVPVWRSFPSTLSLNAKPAANSSLPPLWAGPKGPAPLGRTQRVGLCTQPKAFWALG